MLFNSKERLTSAPIRDSQIENDSQLQVHEMLLNQDNLKEENAKLREEIEKLKREQSSFELDQ